MDHLVLGSMSGSLGTSTSNDYFLFPNGFLHLSLSNIYLYSDYENKYPGMS